MNITRTFGLTPVEKDSVIYIEWSAVDTTPGSEDYKMRNRWNTYASKHCAGKDGIGKYYDSKKHANEVIRGFKAAEQQRAQKAKDDAEAKAKMEANLLPFEKVDFDEPKKRKR